MVHGQVSRDDMVVEQDKKNVLDKSLLCMKNCNVHAGDVTLFYRLHFCSSKYLFFHLM